MTKRKRGVILAVVGFVILSLFCAGLVPPIPGTDILFFLIFGWISFLFRVLPRIEVRWAIVGSAAVYVGLFIVGAHYFFRWLGREMTPREPGDYAAVVRAWPWKWTAQIFLLIVLAFASGMAATGAMRQTEWLAGSKKPIYDSYRRRLLRHWCEANLLTISRSLDAYQSRQNCMPDSLETLKKWNDANNRYELIDLQPPFGIGYENGRIVHLSQDAYLYFGATMKPDADAHAVLVVDALNTHHGAGIHVLYKDGTIDWLEDDDARSFLRRLPATMPSTAPSSEAQPK